MTTGLTPLECFLIGFITSFLTSLILNIINHKRGGNKRK